MLALVVSACSSGTERSTRETPTGLDLEQPFPVTLQDDEGARATLKGPPQRIVSFAPSHTEIVFALGLGNRLVGVSGPLDDYPPEAASIEAVAEPSGDEPDAEKVLSLQPDVLLAGSVGGEWKEGFRQQGVPVFTTLALSFEDALADIGTLGRLLGAQEEANELIGSMALAFGEVQERLRGDPPVTCFLDLGDLRTVGLATLELDLLRKAGCKPITKREVEAYPRWTPEQVTEGDPDVYLVTEGASPAVRVGRIEEVKAALISRPGPRLVQGIEELAVALHGKLLA